MRRQTELNINTAPYYDKFFKDKVVTRDRVLRQEKFMEHVGEGKTIELACGLSYFCQMAKKKYPNSEVWGLDFSTTAKERMSKEESVPEESVNYVVGNALDTPFKDNYFDYVVSGEFLEHLEKPMQLIDEMYRLCKPGGLMILSTPHLETPDPEHLWEYDVQDVVDMFSSKGCTPETEVVESDFFPGRFYIIAWAKKP